MNLNESHRRHLAVSLRHAAELLEEADRILSASRSESPFRKYTSDLAPWQAGVIADQIALIRRKLAEAGEEMKLDVAGHAFDARHAIHVQAAFAESDIHEMQSRYLRGYGALDDDTARRVDALSDALENSIRELDRTLRVPPGESIDARIERLSRSPVSPELLKTLDQLITKYHIAELRRPMATLIDRIEQRTLNIAVFGRVSSGKSSLLNALLGAPILPVGVTPITAVPTRIRFGDPASVRVVYASKVEEVMDMEQLEQLASEASNPGNEKRVSLLQVRYPSPLLREGIEFVDTPGIGSLATRGAEETFAYLPRADVAVLLIDVGSAIGPDELSILRLLHSAAIPVQIVISKADLADATSIERMQSYVQKVTMNDVGLRITVQPVSSVPGGEHLLRQWIDESIEPLLESHEATLDASIRRTAGAIREAIVARLETLSNKRPRQALASVDQEAREILHTLRQTIRDLPDAVARTVPDALRGAAERLAARTDDTWNPRGVLAVVAQERLDDARSRLLASQRETKSRLRELGASVGLTPELLQLADSAEELQHMPLLDVAAALPSVEIRPPLFGGASRITKLLEHRFGKSLHEALRAHSYGLHDWATRSLNRVQTSFTSALDSIAAETGSPDLDLGTIDDDLLLLQATERSTKVR